MRRRRSYETTQSAGKRPRQREGPVRITSCSQNVQCIPLQLLFDFSCFFLLNGEPIILRFFVNAAAILWSFTPALPPCLLARQSTSLPQNSVSTRDSYVAIHVLLNSHPLPHPSALLYILAYPCAVEVGRLRAGKADASQKVCE